MQVTKETPSATQVKLTVKANPDELASIKKVVLKRLGQEVKLPGFRAGKAPAELVEKQLNSETYQAEFLNEAVNQLFMQAIKNESVKLTSEPSISITKYVPFETL